MAVDDEWVFVRKSEKNVSERRERGVIKMKNKKTMTLPDFRGRLGLDLALDEFPSLRQGVELERAGQAAELFRAEGAVVLVTEKGKGRRSRLRRARRNEKKEPAIDRFLF